MSKRILIFIGISIIGSSILACSMPLTPATPTPTIEASVTISPSQTFTVSPAPTGEIPVTAASQTATANPLACNKAEFVTDVTYPDNTVVPAGNNFVKTWRLKNTGSCAWTSGYKLIFASGDGMGGAGSVQLTNGTIPPGSSVEASINLIAPAADGTYQGNYRLQSSDGKTFGIGPSADGFFYVKIVVESQGQQADNNADAPEIPVLSRNLKLENPMMTGNDVKMLQNRLLDLGYNSVGTVDGKFGPKTDTAVRAFQGDNGLAEDGIVGKKTWTALWD